MSCQVLLKKIYIPSKNPILYIDSCLSLKSARAFNDDWCAVKLKVSLILFPILTLDQNKSSLSTWPVSLADPHEILLNCTPRHFFLSTHYLLGAWHFLRQKNTGNPDVQMSNLRSRPRAHNWSVAEMGLNSSSPWGVHNEATCFLGGELLEKQIQSCPKWQNMVWAQGLGPPLGTEICPKACFMASMVLDTLNATTCESRGWHAHPAAPWHLTIVSHWSDPWLSPNQLHSVLVFFISYLSNIY